MGSKNIRNQLLPFCLAQEIFLAMLSYLNMSHLPIYNRSNVLVRPSAFNFSFILICRIFYLNEDIIVFTMDIYFLHFYISSENIFFFIICQNKKFTKNDVKTYYCCHKNKNHALLFIKKRLQHRFFPVNIAKLLRTPILKNNCERQLLTL